jgi:hypothetical protein
MRIPLVDMPHVLRDCLPKIVTLGVQLLVDLEVCVCVCVCACFHVYAALYSTRERFYLRLGGILGPPQRKRRPHASFGVEFPRDFSRCAELSGGGDWGLITSKFQTCALHPMPQILSNRDIGRRGVYQNARR